MLAQAESASRSSFCFLLRCLAGLIISMATSCSSCRVYSTASGKLKCCYKGSQGDDGSLLKVRRRSPADITHQGICSSSLGAGLRGGCGGAGLSEVLNGLGLSHWYP